MIFLALFLVTYILGAVQCWLLIDPEDEESVRVRPYVAAAWPYMTCLMLWEELSQ